MRRQRARVGQRQRRRAWTWWMRDRWARLRHNKAVLTVVQHQVEVKRQAHSVELVRTQQVHEVGDRLRIEPVHRARAQSQTRTN